eukprot:3204488-Pleurochrysis_carterae.AAC.1
MRSTRSYADAARLPTSIQKKSRERVKYAELSISGKDSMYIWLTGSERMSPQMERVTGKVL